MKKFLVLLLALTLTFTALISCDSGNQTDSEYVKGKGTLIVGITDFAPMDYKDENGKWTGFDAELATLVAERLGVSVEFFEIADWEKKIFELDSKSVDCVWNGMTLTEEVLAGMSCTAPYVKNKQVVVMKAENTGKYTTLDELKAAGLSFVAESGSAGENAIKDNGLDADGKYLAVQKQSDALLEVLSGAADACVIDSTMAGATVGKGSYAALSAGLLLTEEDYGIGFRKGSDLTATVEGIIADLKADGTLATLAAKYNLTLAD